MNDEVFKHSIEILNVPRKFKSLTIIDIENTQK